MGGRDKAWLLVEDRATLDAAKAGRLSGGLVAGNAFVAGQLQAAGIAHRSGRDLSDYDVALAALAATDADMARIAPQIADLPDPLQAIALAILAREAMRHHALRRAAARLDGVLHQNGPHGPVPVTGLLRGTRDLIAPAPPPVSHGAVRRGDFVLDFRSITGQKLHGTQTRVWQPRVSRRSAWQDRVLNGLAGIALALRPDMPQALRVRLPRIAAQDVPTLALPSDFGPTANAILAETALLFHAARLAMDAVLQDRGLPRRAVFNHVSDAVFAGFQTSLVAAGIPCERSSHGALAAWGEGPRQRVADHLGAIYNWFPGMAVVHPRARDLVSARNRAQVQGKVRLRPAPPRRDGPFRVYAAPNFRPWSEGFWGLTNTCFDTVTLMEELAKAIHATPGTALHLRIKVTAKDMAKPGKRPANRGLFPEDVAHLITPGGPVHDASVGKHSELLDMADTVVTEGLTAVMFEALELRRPVILLVPDPRAMPALPAQKVQDCIARGTRAAVYVASPADDLRAVLDGVRALHLDRPLTDDEVAPYIWT